MLISLFFSKTCVWKASRSWRSLVVAVLSAAFSLRNWALDLEVAALTAGVSHMKLERTAAIESHTS